MIDFSSFCFKPVLYLVQKFPNSTPYTLFDHTPSTYYNIDDMIRTAIASKNIIEFTYHGHDRVAEPHVYGTLNGRKQMLVYQIGGESSSGNLPGWRRINVDEIPSIRITPRAFSGRRPYPSGEHSSFDTILAVATIRDELAE